MLEVDEVLRIAGRLEAMADEGWVHFSPMEARALALDLRTVARDCEPRRTCSMEYRPEYSGDEIYPTEVYKCSKCGWFVNEGKPDYCPSCGAEVLDEDGAN